MTMTERNAQHDEPPVETTTHLAPWRRFVLPVAAVCLILGAIGIVIRLTQGHLPAGYGSYMPWGLWIAVYFHGVGIAAGAFAVTAFGYLRGWKGFRNRLSLQIGVVLVFAAIVPALLAVALDLGQMFRAWELVLSPSFSSMMAFNTWMYIALLLVATLVWFLSLRPDSGWLKPVLALGILVSLMVPSQSGAFLGVVSANPFWHSALLPVMLLVSAMTAGAAVLMVVRALVGDARWAGVQDDPQHANDAIAILRKITLAGLVLYFFLEFAELSIALWSPYGGEAAVRLLLIGPYWWIFWGVHVVIGGLIPLALLLTRKPALWVGAGLILSVAFISSRLNVLMPGQATEKLDGLQEAFFHPRLTYVYTPTLMEYLVALFCLGLGVAVLWIGLRFTAEVNSRLAARNAQKELHDVSA